MTVLFIYVEIALFLENYAYLSPEAAPGTKMWVCWVRGSKGQEWGRAPGEFLEKGNWVPSHQLGDRIWCIKMVNG